MLFSRFASVILFSSLVLFDTFSLSSLVLDCSSFGHKQDDVFWGRSR